MYAECVMVAHAETQSDHEMISIKQKQNLTSFVEVEQTPEFRQRLQGNEKYIGEQLLPASRFGHEHVKHFIKQRGVDLVVVSPQVAALQTCLELFGEQEGVDIFVEPLLHPRINSAGSIPTNVEELLGKFRTQPFASKIEDKSWFLNLGRAMGDVEESESPQEYCLNIIRKHGTFETTDQFLERNLNMRKELFDYLQKTKKRVAILTHPQVLETLTATGWHEDGKLVNPVNFDFGEVKSEHVWIEGVQAEAQEPNMPICG